MTTRPHLDEARVICACQRRAPAAAPTLPRLASRAGRAMPLALSLCLAVSSLGFATVRTAPPSTTAVVEPHEALDELSAPLSESGALDYTVTPADFERARHAYFHRHVPYGDLIYVESMKNGLEPELVAAIVRAESNFRTVAVSNRNATGLMQILPETGRDLGVVDLTDPSANVEAGTKYLRHLYERYRGNLQLTLAAYNAGEGAVRRYEGVPPYRETQQYVRRVGSYHREFRKAVAHLAVHGRAPEGHPAQR